MIDMNASVLNSWIGCQLLLTATESEQSIDWYTNLNESMLRLVKRGRWIELRPSVSTLSQKT